TERARAKKTYPPGSPTGASKPRVAIRYQELRGGGRLTASACSGNGQVAARAGERRGAGWPPPRRPCFLRLPRTRRSGALRTPKPPASGRIIEPREARAFRRESCRSGSRYASGQDDGREGEPNLAVSQVGFHAQEIATQVVAKYAPDLVEALGGRVH